MAGSEPSRSTSATAARALPAMRAALPGLPCDTGGPVFNAAGNVIGLHHKGFDVDPNCQVHGIDGLFAVDASVLPSAGAVNTGLTIMALALRCGDHIAGKQLHDAVAAA